MGEKAGGTLWDGGGNLGGGGKLGKRVVKRVDGVYVVNAKK